MRGHLRMRGPKGKDGIAHWAIVVDMPRAPGQKRDRKWHAFKGTKKEAEAELRKIVTRLDRGDGFFPSKDRVSQFLDRWIAHVKSEVSPKTYERYCGIVNLHLKPTFGMHLLTRLTSIHLDSAYRQWLESGSLRGGRPLSPQTIIHHHRVMHEALSQGVTWGLLSRNVADAATPPKRTRPEIKSLDTQQLGRLLRASDSTRLAAPIFVALTTGVRRGELLALRWSDLDLDSATLSVRRSLEVTRSGVRIKLPKSGRSRAIKLAATTIEILRKHRVAQHAERLQIGPAYGDLDLIFPREDGSIWHPDAFGYRFGSLVKAAGIGHVRLHDLRHCCASLMLKSGVHAKVVSERLGHSTISITLDLYSHVLPGLQEAAAEKIDALLDAALKAH